MLLYCRLIIDVLKDKTLGGAGSSSQPNVDLLTAYSKNLRKFLDDSNTSLDGHVNNYEELVEEMVGQFHQFEEEWNNKLNDLKDKGDYLKKERAILRTKLHVFVHNS